MLHAALLAWLAACPLLVFGLEPVNVARDVYAFIGDGGEINPANGGFVGNAGFIVGSDGIVIVDTGSSYRFAGQMLTAIEKISAKPVRLVILTHATQEFIFGAAFFQDRGIPVLTHRRTAELMQARCETCLENLRGSLGAAYMEGTRVIVPDRQIDSSRTLAVAGRTLTLLHPGRGSTPGDLAVFDRNSGVVFAGGLVSIGRVPDMHDADFSGWLAALDALERLPATVIVPGFGPPARRKDIGQTRSYLKALDRAVRAEYRSGLSLLEAPRRTPLRAFRNWKLYSSLHPRNVQQRYLEVESEEFN